MEMNENMTREEAMAINLLDQNVTDTWSIKEVANAFKKHGIIQDQDPSGDLISRQAVLDELNKWEWQELYLPIHFKENIIDVVPSVNPQEPTDTWSIKDVADTFKKHGLIVEQEPKTGHWIMDSDEEHGHCDQCGNKTDLVDGDYHNFCRKCGAKMVEPQESEDEE